MNNLKFNARTAFITGVILFGAAMRLIPHWPNFTPITAMALFGGVYFQKKHFAIIIPLAAMLISDLILGLHQWMFAVYASFALVVFVGIFIRRRIGIGSILLASVVSSLLFFVVTNFAIWMGSPYYLQNWAGLIECYAAGLPFLINGIFGDLFFNTLFFGGFYLAQLKFPVLLKVKQ